MRFRSGHALAHGAVIAENAERLAVGWLREAAATPFGCLPDRRLRDIFSRGIRVRMGGMTSQ
jgi:hypothetical protein